MFFTSTWFPTRIPVSLVLLPILWLVLAISPNLNQWRALWVLVIFYGILSAAINGFSNYFPQSEEKVSPKQFVLFSFAILLFISSVALSFLFVSGLFSVLVGAYGIVAFAHVYWKNFAPLNRVLAGIVQGIFTFVLLYIGINKFPFESIKQTKILLPGFLITLVLWAFYPVIHKAQNSLWLSSQNAVVKISRHEPLLLSFGLFSLAIIFASHYLGEYVASDYFPPLLIFYAAGVLFLYLKFLHKEIRYAGVITWISILGLNGFFFYVFTDFTNIFQLL